MKYNEVYTPDGQDNGWLKKQNFWFDPDHENGFNIVDLDSIYPEKYFEVDHVKPETIDNYCNLIQKYYENISDEGLPIYNLIEFGSAGGWFLKEFIDRQIKSYGLEGSIAGYQACIKRGIPITNIDIMDFRHSFAAEKGPAHHRYSIALCTEVAEHIEPPFSATLVKSLCDASDLVWFSFEPPNTNPAHIHHPNEMPAKFWINLFDFYGYGCYMLPDWVFDQTEGRGRMIFYNKEVYAGNKFLQQQH